MNKRKIKTFIIRHDQQASLKEMFAGFWKAVDTGKKSIQPKNLMVANSIKTILTAVSEPRLEIFYTLVEKKPNSLKELAKLLNKDYANVWRDCQALSSLGIIKLKKEGKEIKPIALYERIIFDFQSRKTLQRELKRVYFLDRFREMNEKVNFEESIYNCETSPLIHYSNTSDEEKCLLRYVCKNCETKREKDFTKDWYCNLKSRVSYCGECIKNHEQ